MNKTKKNLSKYGKQINQLNEYVDYCNNLQELYLKKHQEVMDLYGALKLLNKKLSKRKNRDIKKIFNSIDNMKKDYNSKKLRNNLNKKIKEQKNMRKKNKNSYNKISNKIKKIKLKLK